MSRKNFSSLSHFASKAGIGSGSAASSTTAVAPTSGGSVSSSSGNTHANGYGSGGTSGGGVAKRPTWADKIREKLPELGENEYEVLWERGVLGVIFLESEKDGIPYVSKATESCISPAVSAGDVLKYVNIVRSKDHSFSDFFKILATMKKPVLLRFERPASSTTSSDEDSPLEQRSSSAIGMGDRSVQGDVGPKALRSNSAPQNEKQKSGRSAFWRTVASKEPSVVTDPVPAPVPAPVPSPVPSPAPSPVQQTFISAPTMKRDTISSLPRADQYGHVETKHYDVSPRDVYKAYAQESVTEYYEYEVYWETGSLGLFFGEDRLTNLPVVTRSTPGANPVVQRMVAVNDTLVSANGVQSREFSFEAFFGRLQQMNKPVRLVFKRKVDASPAHVPARGRKPSVTVDELASPGDLDPRHRSPVEDGNQGRRVPTPPLQLPIVEEQEVADHISAARTPPDSPVRARESQRILKSKLDTALRDPKPVSPYTRDASATSSTHSESNPKRTAAPPPLNLARDTAAIMSSLSEPHRHRGSAPSPTPGSRESVTIASAIPESQPKRNSAPSPLNLTRDSASIMANHSESQGERSPVRSPPSAVRASVPQVDGSPSPFHSPPRGPVPDVPVVQASHATQSLSPSHSAVRDSVPAMAIVPEPQATRSPAPSPVPLTQNPVATKDSVSELHSPLSAVHSPLSSPSRADQHSLMYLDTESKAEVKPERSPPAEAPLRKSNADEARKESSPQSRNSASEESLSIWEIAAQDNSSEMQPVDESHVSAETADVVVAVVAAEVDVADYSQDPAANVPEFAFAEAVEEVDVGVELGVVAEVEMGIVVEVSDHEANPLPIVSGEPTTIAQADTPLSPDDSMVDQPPQLDDPISSHSEESASDVKSDLEGDDGNDKVELADMDPDAMDAIDQEPDITVDIDGNDMMPEVSKIKGSTFSPFKNNKSTVSANLAKYKRKAKNSRAVTKLPALTEEDALTVPLIAPNAVNTNVQVRGRSKPKPSMLETPDSTTYLVKWKESRSIGLQLKEVRFAKGVYPLVTDVCQEPCCEMLKHVCVGDIIVEINGRNTSLMGVKKTVNFLKTCTKTTLMKLRHGPAFVSQRVSAYV